MLNQDPRFGSSLPIVLRLRPGLANGLGQGVDGLCCLRQAAGGFDELVVPEYDAPLFENFGLLVVVDSEPGEQNFVLVGSQCTLLRTRG
jgi:hypothetical protein